MKTVFTTEVTAPMELWQRHRRRGPATVVSLAVALGALTTGCATSVGTAGSGGRKDVVRVVAAENIWGSLAAQLGGTRAQVTSIIDNPNTDPHDYEPTAADARALATAQLVVVNGVGYDGWTGKLLDANPVDGRRLLTVGDLVGVSPGGNPHLWYSPAVVRRVVDAITAAYTQLEPRNGRYFEQQHATVLSTSLNGYFSTIAAIRARYAGTAVGASESVFAPLAQALGLNLLTPASYLAAVSEGGEPAAADKSLIDRQIRTGLVKVYVYNSQNATPDVQAQIDAARAQGIPVATVTETPTPAGATFEQWQVRQLVGLRQTLARATGR
jgi:zinc/manganese transport system substrate-binding protein